MENVILMDYMESINILSSLALVGLSFIVIVRQQTELLAFIESLEKLINKSNPFYRFDFQIFKEKQIQWDDSKIVGLVHETSKALYEDTNQLVERISGIFYAVFVNVLPSCIVCSQFVTSFAKYFSTDLAGDAFELPIGAW